MIKQPLRSIRVGLIGSGIQASRSPALHEREGRENGLNYSYQLFDLERLPERTDALAALVSEAEAHGLAGLNITHPCKQTVIHLLDELAEDATIIGAVNTVVFSDGRRVGYNTDCSGFIAGFQRGLPQAPLDRVLLVGAGGAGSAVAVAALRLGVQQLLIHDADQARVSVLVERLQGFFPNNSIASVTDLPMAVRSVQGLIQATPMGMAAYPGSSVPLDVLKPHQWVAEVIYFPLETELLRYARALGCATVDGGGMAVFQAVEAFRLFTNLVPDAERMLRHFAVLA